MTTANPRQQNRAYGAAHFLLELDGDKDVGLFKSVEGGNVKTDFIKYQNGAEHGVFQRLGRPKYDDIKISVGAAMGAPFYDWIKEFFAGKAVRKNGAIAAGDFWYQERARREFFEAMITELTFPKLDGTDKSACFMNVTLSPETVEYKPGSGAKFQPREHGFDKQRSWAACNFTFTLDGFEDACKRVTKVDSFTIKQKPIEYAHGGLRHSLKVPGRIEYPNIAFYVPEAHAQPFFDYHAKRVLKGELQSDTRLKGAIHCQDSTNETNVFEVEFLGADIFAVTAEKNDATSDEIKLVKIEICVESMTFKWLG